jgi:hypothetical protein
MPGLQRFGDNIRYHRIIGRWWRFSSRSRLCSLSELLREPPRLG